MKAEKPADAAEAFERIAKGASYVAMIVRARMSEAQDALDRGDFTEAHRRLSEAHTKLHSLMTAQGELGVFNEESRVVRAHQLDEGDTLLNMGRITTKTEDEDEVVSVLLEDGSTKRFHREQELIVQNAAS